MKASAFYTALSFYSLVIFFLISVVLIYQSPRRWHDLLTVFLGLITAFIDVQSSVVSFSILLLLSFGFFLGYLKTSTPLRTGFLFAVWLPLAALIHLAVLGKEAAFLSEGVASFISFIPAIGGSYLGNFIRTRSKESPRVNDVLI